MNMCRKCDRIAGRKTRHYMKLSTHSRQCNNAHWKSMELYHRSNVPFSYQISFPIPTQNVFAACHKPISFLFFFVTAKHFKRKTNQQKQSKPIWTTAQSNLKWKAPMQFGAEQMQTRGVNKGPIIMDQGWNIQIDSIALLTCLWYSASGATGSIPFEVVLSQLPSFPRCTPHPTPCSGCGPGGSLSIIHCQIHKFHFLHNLYLSGKEPEYSNTKSPFISLEIFECIQLSGLWPNLLPYWTHLEGCWIFALIQKV